MPDDIHQDDEDFKVYDDYEEYVDLDEHERARAYEARKKADEEQEREHPETFYDEYDYGVDEKIMRP